MSKEDAHLTVEEYLEDERAKKYKHICSEQIQNKFLDNTKLITKLDQVYKMRLAYPYSKDPNLLEFWCDLDPAQFNSFRTLLIKKNKNYKVQHVGPSDYFIEIRSDD